MTWSSLNWFRRERVAMNSFTAKRPSPVFKQTLEDKKNRSQLGFVRVATVSEIPLGEGKTCKVMESEIAIFRLASNEILAVDNACPHSGGPLSHGILSDDVVSCPLHGFKLNLRSGRAVGEDARVRVYPVKTKGSVIFVQI